MTYTGHYTSTRSESPQLTVIQHGVPQPRSTTLLNDRPPIPTYTHFPWYNYADIGFYPKDTKS